MVTESVISSVYPTVVKLLNSAQTPVSLCLVGSGGLVLQSRTKSGSWKNLWMRSLSFITPCLLALQCPMF